MATYPSVDRKSYVASILSEMRAANLLTQDEWNQALSAWAGGEGDGVAVGSIHELGSAIWAEALKAKAHHDVRFHFPRWAEELQAIFDMKREQTWKEKAQRLGIPD